MTRTKAKTTIWLSNQGHRIANPLRNPRPVHGASSPTGILQWLMLHGERVEVRRHGLSFAVQEDGAVVAIGSVVELENGECWWVKRSLKDGRWVGEPVEDVGIEGG